MGVGGQSLGSLRMKLYFKSSRMKQAAQPTSEDLFHHLSAILVLINHISLFGTWIPRRHSVVVENKRLVFNSVVANVHTPLLYFSFGLSSHAEKSANRISFHVVLGVCWYEKLSTTMDLLSHLTSHV